MVEFEGIVAVNGWHRLDMAIVDTDLLCHFRSFALFPNTFYLITSALLTRKRGVPPNPDATVLHGIQTESGT